MTFAAPAQPSALAAKGPAARVRGRLRGRIIIGVLPIATAAGFLIVWEAIVRGLKISPVILPSPSQVYQKVITVLPLLVDNSVQTGGEAVLGLGLAAAVGIALGSALAYSKYFRAAIYPNLVFFQLIPKVALAPLFVIWLGIGIESRLTFTIFITFFPIAISTAVGLAFIGVIVAEFITSQSGLGYLILFAMARTETAVVLGSIAFLCVIGIGVYGAVALLEVMIRRVWGAPYDAG